MAVSAVQKTHLSAAFHVGRFHKNQRRNRTFARTHRELREERGRLALTASSYLPSGSDALHMFQASRDGRAVAETTFGMFHGVARCRFWTFHVVSRRRAASPIIATARMHAAVLHEARWPTEAAHATSILAN